MERNYGTVNYNGKTYTLTEQPEFKGVQNKRIDNSIYVLDSNNYSASCVDNEENECIAYWEVINEDADEENCCDWENASYIEEL